REPALVEPVHEDLLGAARDRLDERQVDVGAAAGRARAVDGRQPGDRGVQAPDVERLPAPAVLDRVLGAGDGEHAAERGGDEVARAIAGARAREPVGRDPDAHEGGIARPGAGAGAERRDLFRSPARDHQVGARGELREAGRRRGAFALEDRAARAAVEPDGERVDAVARVAGTRAGAWPDAEHVRPGLGEELPRQPPALVGPVQDAQARKRSRVGHDRRMARRTVRAQPRIRDRYESALGSGRATTELRCPRRSTRVSRSSRASEATPCTFTTSAPRRLPNAAVVTSTAVGGALAVASVETSTPVKSPSKSANSSLSATRPTPRGRTSASSTRGSPARRRGSSCGEAAGRARGSVVAMRARAPVASWKKGPKPRRTLSTLASSASVGRVPAGTTRTKAIRKARGPWPAAGAL